MAQRRTKPLDTSKEKAQAETRRWLEEHPESAEATDRGFEAIRRGEYKEVKLPANKT